MRKLCILTAITGLGLLIVAAGAQGLELRAGASFNTVAMGYLNELIDTYNVREGTGIPNLESGLSLFGSIVIGFPLLDLGLEVESISASTSGLDSHGNPARVSASALGFLGMGALTILRGGLQALVFAALGQYSADYFSDLEGLRAQGSGSGYKLGITLRLELARNLALNGIFSVRNLVFNELTDQRGNIITTHGRPYLDFSGFELGIGVGLHF